MNRNEEMPYWLLIGIAVAGIGLIIQTKSLERAKRKRGALFYRPRLVLRFLFGLGAHIFGIGFYRTASYGHYEWWLPFLLVSAFIILFCTWPGTIVLETQGLEYFRLGFRAKELQWHNVKYAIRYSKEIVVVGVNGVEIIHKSFHIDEPGFIEELRKHTKVIDAGSRNNKSLNTGR